jgi:hypothetical protein
MESPKSDHERTGILAPDISCFEWSKDVVRALWRPEHPFVITNLGLELVTRTQAVSLDTIDPDCEIHIIQLNCLKYRVPCAELVPVEIALIQCKHSYPRVQRSRCNDVHGRGYEMSDLFLKTRKEAREAKFYIKLTSQHWGECRDCRGSEWILINEIPSPSARFITRSISNARWREQNAQNAQNGES